VMKREDQTPPKGKCVIHSHRSQLLRDEPVPKGIQLSPKLCTMNTDMHVKMISPAIVVARSYCVANGLPGTFGAGYISRALSIVVFVCGMIQKRSENH
jgi:hypothetical protein